MRDVKLIYILAAPLLLTSCTFSIIQTDTHGVATDVVDSVPTTETDVEAEAHIPAIA